MHSNKVIPLMIRIFKFGSKTQKNWSAEVKKKVVYHLSIAAAQGNHVDREPQRRGLARGGDHQEQREALQHNPQLVSHLSQIRTCESEMKAVSVSQASLLMESWQKLVCGLSSEDVWATLIDVTIADLTGTFAFPAVY